ncbi:MAG: hypothetical protein Q8N23_12250 [Archangium sp.]|nr:hypothetical protein [Archangium sp.]MDP3153440.1 hypothetical protein [Archangium sp.]MDP3574676.1 hypothetical protein [Archangium sp.]
MLQLVSLGGEVGELELLGLQLRVKADQFPLFAGRGEQFLFGVVEGLPEHEEVVGQRFAIFGFFGQQAFEGLDAGLRSFEGVSELAIV